MISSFGESYSAFRGNSNQWFGWVGATLRASPLSTTPPKGKESGAVVPSYTPCDGKLVKIWSGRRESNSQPTAWKAVTLPLSYSRADGGHRIFRVYQSKTASPHFSRID